MIDRTKAIIGLLIAICVLIGYAVKLEHRLTVMEQQNVLLQNTLEDIDDNQRRMMAHLFFD